jgi:hypothetical protein
MHRALSDQKGFLTQARHLAYLSTALSTKIVDNFAHSSVRLSPGNRSGPSRP